MKLTIQNNLYTKDVPLAHISNIAKDKRIIYMGTPAHSASLLEYLVINNYNVVALIAQEDKPVGRKNVIKHVPTKEIAIKYNIPVFQPKKIRLDYEFIKELCPDVIITFAYGQIVPQELLDIPNLGCINFHASLLPKYRGAAPIQRAIMNGDDRSGVCLMEMTNEMDAGKVYVTSTFDIKEEDNFDSLLIKVIDASKQIVDEALDLFLNNLISGEKQNELNITMAPKITKEEEKLDLANDSYKQFNIIRGLSSNPGAYVFLDEKKLKILSATYEVVNHDNRNIGEIVSTNGGIKYVAKDGFVVIKTLQLEGKSISDWKSFANGRQNLLGSVLK